MPVGLVNAADIQESAWGVTFTSVKMKYTLVSPAKSQNLSKYPQSAHGEGWNSPVFSKKGWCGSY